MRCFQNIAKLIRTKRVAHAKGYSQSELSHLLGYKNGQFISNVERALCNIPLKMLRRVSEILDIPAEDIKLAILKDQEATLNRYLYGAVKAATVNRKSGRKAKTEGEVDMAAVSAEASAVVNAELASSSDYSSESEKEVASN